MSEKPETKFQVAHEIELPDGGLDLVDFRDFKNDGAVIHELTECIPPRLVYQHIVFENDEDGETINRQRADEWLEDHGYKLGTETLVVWKKQPQIDTWEYYRLEPMGDGEVIYQRQSMYAPPPSLPRYMAHVVTREEYEAWQAEQAKTPADCFFCGETTDACTCTPQSRFEHGLSLLTDEEAAEVQHVVLSTNPLRTCPVNVRDTDEIPVLTTEPHTSEVEAAVKILHSMNEMVVPFFVQSARPTPKQEYCECWTRDEWVEDLNEDSSEYVTYCQSCDKDVPPSGLSKSEILIAERDQLKSMLERVLAAFDTYDSDTDNGESYITLSDAISKARELVK